VFVFSGRVKEREMQKSNLVFINAHARVPSLMSLPSVNTWCRSIQSLSTSKSWFYAKTKKKKK
jgi:hypothetical protein